MDESQMRDKLQNLFDSQKLGVLATNEDGQPHNRLVAVAGTLDLKCLLFCTSRETTKYRAITVDPRVSLLIDNRANMESDFAETVAVTALGLAIETVGTDRDELVDIYTGKHPYLKNFVHSQDSVLIRIDVKEYTISGFKDVWTLRP
jgi:uncharacterized pyridoxamine 5'-phosphate oxidase family protein